MKSQPFLYRATCELLGVEDINVFASEALMMIDDSEKCVRDGYDRWDFEDFCCNEKAA
jgi:hypothetical protein